MGGIDSGWFVCVSVENEWVGWGQLVWVMRFGGGWIISILSEELRDAMWMVEDRNVD